MENKENSRGAKSAHPMMRNKKQEQFV